MIERLSADVAGLRRNGPLSVQDAQKVASSITEAQLQLNELERVDIREHGVSREMAERFAQLDGRIRTLRYELYQGLTNRGVSAAGEDIGG
jgi:TolA-binding protein